MKTATTDSPRVIALGFDRPFTLLVTWKDGSRSRHDLSKTIATKGWAACLADPGVFCSAVVEDDGWQIVWPGTEIAFSADGLWEDTHPPAKPAPAWMSAEEFSDWMRRLEFTYPKASEALEVSQRMLKYYAAGTHEIPKTVFLACMQLASERARASRR
jgi:Protein of unknown function (DUF2442)